MKLSTKQAIRAALKKKKGKKHSQVKGLDNSGNGKGNDSKELDHKKINSREKSEIQNTLNILNCTDSQADNMLLPDILDIKKKMSEKELKFLELYLTGKRTREEAMILAGYVGYSNGSLQVMANRIVLKHECQAGDHRKIFRSIGAGETAIAMGLLDLARCAKSEMVRLNAWAHLAKCLGLTKEVLESAEGIQIVINQGCATASPEQPPNSPPHTSGPITVLE